MKKLYALMALCLGIISLVPPLSIYISKATSLEEKQYLIH